MPENKNYPIKQEHSIKRRYSTKEKNELWEKISRYRMIGMTFYQISKEVGIDQRNVRRHWDQYLEEYYKDWKESKQKVVAGLMKEFENSLQRANTQLLKAMNPAENQVIDEAKIAAYMRIRQECLRDYKDYMREVGVLNDDELKKIDEDEPVVQVMKEYKKALKERLNNAKLEKLPVNNNTS